MSRRMDSTRRKSLGETNLRFSQMPTYQTTPYISWTFPDEAIRMNKKGFQPLKPVDLPQQDRLVGAKSPFADSMREMALAALHTNRVKEQGMLFHRNTTERTQAFDRPAHLSQTRINGKFMAPSYEFSQTAGGLRGGTGLITPEGRAWGKQQLMNRIKELDQIDSGDYYEGPPPRTNLDPKLDALDSAFSQFLDQWEAGAIPGSLVEQANRTVGELYKVGAVITPSKLAQYVEVVARLQVQADRMAAAGGIYTFKEEKRTILRAVVLIFNRFQTLAEEIARVINEPEQVRRMVLEDIGARMLKGAVQGQAVAGETQPFVPRGPFVPGGRETPGIRPGGRPEMPFGQER